MSKGKTHTKCSKSPLFKMITCSCLAGQSAHTTGRDGQELLTRAGYQPCSPAHIQVGEDACWLLPPLGANSRGCFSHGCSGSFQTSSLCWSTEAALVSNWLPSAVQAVQLQSHGEMDCCCHSTAIPNTMPQCLETQQEGAGRMFRGALVPGGLEAAGRLWPLENTSKNRYNRTCSRAKSLQLQTM